MLSDLIILTVAAVFGGTWMHFAILSIQTKRAERAVLKAKIAFNEAARRGADEIGRKLASEPEGGIFGLLKAQLEDCNNPDCPIHSKPAGGTR